jgi:hypothetical protein
MRKTMIALAAAFAVCTATMTSGATAAFARGGGSFGGGLMALAEAALEVTDLRWAAVTLAILGGRVRPPWPRFWRPTLRSIWIWPLWIRGRVLLRLRLWNLLPKALFCPVSPHLRFASQRRSFGYSEFGLSCLALQRGER